MKTLTKTEIETVVGGFRLVARPVRPTPLPANEPVIINGRPSVFSF
ncbi:MAG: hypothetical protein ABJ205_07650 [Erythrobacter sp.]